MVGDAADGAGSAGGGSAGAKRRRRGRGRQDGARRRVLRQRALSRLRALRWRRVALRAGWATAAMFFLTGVVFGTWASRLPAVKQDLELSAGQLALAFLFLEGAAVAGLQLGGVVVPRTGSRVALAWAMPSFVVALGLLGLVPGLVALAGVLVLFAAANSVVDVAINASGVAVQHTLDRPVLSRMHAMHSIGGIVGAGVGALAAWADVGRGPHFLAVGTVVAMAAMAATRRLLPPVLEQDADAQLAVPAEDRRSRPVGADAAEPVTGWRRGWSRGLLAVGVLAFCLTFAEGAANNWSAVYLRDELGSGPGIAAASVAVFLTALSAGRLAGDRLLARFGPGRAFRAAAVLGGVGFGGCLLLDTTAAGLAGFVLLGLGLSVTLPVAIAAAGERTEVSTATAVSRVSTLGYLGSFVAPAVIGALAGRIGLTAALIVPAVLILVALPLSRTLQPAGLARRNEDRASTTRTGPAPSPSTGRSSGAGSPE